MRTLLLLFVGIVLQQTVFAQVNKSITEGNTFYRNGQYDLAERSYREALQKDQQNAIAQNNLGNALYKQRRYDEAEKIWGTLGTNNPAKPVKATSFYNQGVIYSKQKELDKSIEAYKAALRNDPTDKQARENLQKALLEKKKQQQEQQSQQKQKSSMSQSQAERQLQQLQEKEKNIRERMQQGQGGTPMPKDW
jgi:Ca-activated chloride channel family protein